MELAETVRRYAEALTGYEWARSANERFHSQLKHPNSSGITSGARIEMRGIAKVGLGTAVAVAVTNEHLIQDHATKHIGDDELATFCPREFMRRHRQAVIRREKEERQSRAQGQ